MKLTLAEIDVIEKVYEDISTNFLQQQEISSICKKYKISETKLTKGFKSLYGITIYACYLELKMHYAKEQLKKGEDVSYIANQLHYSSASSFTRAFRKVYPRPPSFYRYRND